MTIRGIHSRAGSLSSYLGYIFLVFIWYFAANYYAAQQPLVPGSLLETTLFWAYRLLVVPLVLAGVFGGIHQRQESQDELFGSRFWDAVGSNYWRFAVVNLFFTVSIVLLVIIIGVAAALSGADRLPDLNQDPLFLGLTFIPYSAVLIFWYSAIVVEGRVFKGLFRALGTLLRDPLALAVGVLWGLVGFADGVFFELQNDQIPIAVHALRAAVLAVFRVLAVMYALAIYKSKWLEARDLTTGEVTPVPSVAVEPGDSLVKTSFGLAFFAFFPVVHLAALALGILALRRRSQFSLRAVLAVAVGGFFTLYYSLLVIGLLVAQSSPPVGPGFRFLSESHPDLAPYAALLESGELLQFQVQFDQEAPPEPERHWGYDTASALVKLNSNDLDGALSDFHAASAKDPEKGEFYYFYGVALLRNEQTELALGQFQAALERQPGLVNAERYITLIQSAYSPSVVVSAISFAVILLVLFTVHEYGHAYAAWKLGDDTAKMQGRLTLNPIPHMDPLGSLLLPAILILRQSETVFGWARPVPVNPANFKDPLKDHQRVSFAGPGINLLVSMVGFFLLAVFLLAVRVIWPETLALDIATPFSAVSIVGPPFARILAVVVVFVKQLVFTSLILGCFNLIPIPPLDGSWILSGLLPAGMRNILERVRPYSFLIFIILVLTPVFDYLLLVPVGLAWGGLQVFASALGLG